MIRSLKDLVLNAMLPPRGLISCLVDFRYRLDLSFSLIRVILGVPLDRG
jgi:hypothetical protein